MRLLLLLVQLAAKAVAAYAAEVVAMVKILCEDPFHEVNVEVCSVVLTLNGMKRGGLLKEQTYGCGWQGWKQRASDSPCRVVEKQ